MLRPIRALAPVLLLPALVACGEDGTDPDDTALEFFIGTYVLSPAPTMTCDLDALGTATIVIDTVEVVDATSDSIFLRLPARVTSDAFPPQRFDAEFALAAESDGSFGGLEPIEADFDAGLLTVHGDGEFGLDGTYSQDNDSFVALVESSFSVALGSGTPTDCTDVDLSVIGSRVD